MRKIDNIENVIESMTLEEKCKLVNGYNFFGSNNIERFGIDRIQFLDGGTGINFEQLFGDFTQMNDYSSLFEEKKDNLIGSKILKNVISNFYNKDSLKDEEKKLLEWIEDILLKRLNNNMYSPGCFPPGILLGATWNKAVVRKLGEALGLEALIYGIDVLLGTPNVNIQRDPLGGRLFEGYSEDPCLVSVLAPELVKGVQSTGVAANVKHYAANNQETNRIGVNEIISQRALEEIYLPGFKACVVDGQIKTVMSAYNKINGTPCTENEWLLTEKLREEYGFDGIVVSDWGAVYNDVKALNAGNDLAMPGPRDSSILYDAVKNNQLDEALLDRAVYRILNLINWIADNKNNKDIDYKKIRKYTDEVAYESATEGIVLLENKCLPLSKNKKLVLMGSGARKLLECGQGSAGIDTNRVGNLYKELCEYVGEENVYFEDDIIENNGLKNNKIEESYGEDDSVINIFIASVAGMEGNDRKDLYLDKEDRKKLLCLNRKTILVLNTCGPVDLREIDKEIVLAIIEVFLPGMGGCKALADILFGRVCPSGKLPITFPKKYQDTPSSINFPGDGMTAYYGEGIFVGYRYYDKKEIEPLYPFGYGLSYTSFEKKLVSVEENDDKIIAKVYIKNTGNYDGSEVIQVYVSDVESTLIKPIKELKAFEKVFLKIGEEKIVNIELDKMSLASYDTDYMKFILEEGYYDIILATSSSPNDEFGRKRIYIDVKSMYSYGINSTMKTIFDSKELRECLYKVWESFKLDLGIIEDAYQYFSSKTLEKVIDEICNISDSEKKKIKSSFEKLCSKIKKI